MPILADIGSIRERRSPMAAISATPLEYTRRLCPDCHGTRLTAKLYPGCRACHACWTPTRFDAYIEAHDRPRWFRRNRYRWNVALPCSHPLTALAYRPINCPTCYGVGTIGHWDLSQHYRERITPPATRTSYRPSRYPVITPMQTPPLAETPRADRRRVYDWQRGRLW